MIKDKFRNYKVFIDFDGTITKKDVGENLFYEFGDRKKVDEIVNLWITGEISSSETWRRLCNSIDSITGNQLNTFLDTMEIDDYFTDFLLFLKENNIEFFILSDGMDLYIKYILKKYGLENLSVFSNKMILSENKFIVSFPFSDEVCKTCGNCKRNHIINLSSDEEFTIYIGDGYSDTCAAQYCDIIFAKNSLLNFCEKNRISYFPYSNFNDIKILIIKLLEKKRLKKRHQAELKRKELYLQG